MSKARRGSGAGGGPRPRPGGDESAIWVPPSARKPTESASPGDELTPTEASAIGDVLEEEAGPAPVEDAAPGTDYKDRYLRLLAETENVRRRTQEQAAISVQRANEQLLEKLLPVVDGFGRALAAAREGGNVESLVQGLELLDKQLRTFLEGVGVEEIPCEAGDPFDPDLHEAVMRVEASEELPEGHVATVFERGYRLNGRPIRHVRVAVAAPPLDAEAD